MKASSGIARRTVALNGTNGNEHCAVPKNEGAFYGERPFERGRICEFKSRRVHNLQLMLLYGFATHVM